jgi:hypothetical protein
MTKPTGISWTMFFIERWFMPLFLAGSLVFIGGATSLYMTVHDLTGAVRHNTDDIKSIQAELNAIRTNAITRSELLEILKRVEQQLEIMTLKAKVQEKLKLTKE